MTYTQNPQLEKAFEYIQNTNQNIFLTGKAGTGKTTFLHHLKKTCTKRMAIVAPTGVAAINAKGMTIHSLFQLPFGPYVPGLKQEINRQRKFSKKKVNLLKSLDLLIIDEISMVRADILDAIDDVLRRYKDSFQPFGGLQLLMIGDLHQLPPVARRKEWQVLKEYYPSPYFFDSNALKKTNPITIELTHIYRQSDADFIDLLNKVRDNQIDESVLATLNSRYIINFHPQKEDGYITLTALNRTAQAINEEKLNTLKGVKQRFKAKIQGDFPVHTFPTEEILDFKIGAQVLFIRNDPSHEKQFYNGKIGEIVEFTKNSIYVKCPNDSKAIQVTPMDWNNVEYSLEESTKEIIEKEKGCFTQYPLKLAWAITIHKSQGLTFEKTIIDAQAAFAHGQVYVALSRCKSFEGIVLRSPINYSSVQTDQKVSDYSEEAAKNKPDAAHLLTAKQKFQQQLINGLFNFREVRISLNEVAQLFLMEQNKLTVSAFQQVHDWEQKAEAILFATAYKFEPILKEYFQETALPEGNPVLLNRIKKAGKYFTKKIKEDLLVDLRAIPVVVDNQELKAKAESALKALEKSLFIKYRCFLEVEKNEFSTQRYLQVKSNAAIDFEKIYKNNKQKNQLPIPLEVPYPALYRQLFFWRNAKAAELKRQPHDVFPTVSLIDMTKKLPVDKKAMEQIKGFGTVKLKTFGKALMQLIDDFCYEFEISPNVFPNETKQTATLLENDKAKAYSIEKIRQKHPKAYEKWTDSEEQTLQQLKKEGKSNAFIAGALGRDKGAISARLKKLKEREGAVIVFS